MRGQQSRICAGDKNHSSHPPSAGFANSTFNGLNAFRFINADDISTPVRRPIMPAKVETEASGNCRDFNFDSLVLFGWASTVRRSSAQRSAGSVLLALNRPRIATFGMGAPEIGS